nr:hypothetical protein [Kibdelosporangium sp. MJ126-NF4]CEL16757.1 putative membrane protein [Kibdelosporangium sp. MJ126-NF4]CTQ92014.1 putative membrane protein [Kibdelosporangium sp. MJ126-NF4]
MSAPGGGYKGLGYYDDKPQAKKPTGLIVAVVVAAVVVVGLVAALVIVRPTTAVTGEALPMADATTKSSTGKPKPSDNPLSPQATGAPKVPGWKPIPINNGRELKTTKAYDVPPKWEPMTSAAVFGQPPSTFSLFVPAVFMRGFCPESPNSFRAIAGLASMKNEGDTPTQAIAAAQRVGDAVYTTKAGVKPKITMGQPQPVTIDQDKKAVAVSATIAITPGPEDKCPTTTAAVSVAVIESKTTDQTNIIIAAIGDQGVPDAVAAADFDKVITSMHPAN